MRIRNLYKVEIKFLLEHCLEHCLFPSKFKKKFNLDRVRVQEDGLIQVSRTTWGESPEV